MSFTSFTGPTSGHCPDRSKTEGIRRSDTFGYGLRLGIVLMAEVFSGREQVAGNGE